MGDITKAWRRVTKGLTMSELAVLADSVSPASQPPSRAGLASIVVFNDHPVFRAGFIWKLGEECGIEILADAGSLAETIERTALFEPEAVVADMRIGDGNSEGVESVETLAGKFSGVPVIVYSDFYSTSYVRRMREAGAAAFVLKSAGPHRLAEAIHQAVADRKASLLTHRAAA